MLENGMHENKKTHVKRSWKGSQKPWKTIKKTMPKEGLQKRLIYEPVLARNGKRVAWLVPLKGTWIIWGARGRDADIHPVENGVLCKGKGAWNNLHETSQNNWEFEKRITKKFGFPKRCMHGYHCIHAVEYASPRVLRSRLRAQHIAKSVPRKRHAREQ